MYEIVDEVERPLSGFCNNFDVVSLKASACSFALKASSNLPQVFNIEISRATLF